MMVNRNTWETPKALISQFLVPNKQKRFTFSQILLPNLSNFIPLVLCACVGGDSPGGAEGPAHYTEFPFLPLFFFGLRGFRRYRHCDIGAGPGVP